MSCCNGANFHLSHIGTGVQCCFRCWWFWNCVLSVFLFSTGKRISTIIAKLRHTNDAAAGVDDDVVFGVVVDPCDGTVPSTGIWTDSYRYRAIIRIYCNKYFQHALPDSSQRCLPFPTFTWSLASLHVASLLQLACDYLYRCGGGKKKLPSCCLQSAARLTCFHGFTIASLLLLVMTYFFVLVEAQLSWLQICWWKNTWIWALNGLFRRALVKRWCLFINSCVSTESIRGTFESSSNKELLIVSKCKIFRRHFSLIDH